MQYKIPREIRINETVGYGLTGRQMMYGVLGIAGTILTLKFNIGLEIRIVISILSIMISFMLSMAKKHGQHLDRYALNSVRYAMRDKNIAGGNEHVQESKPTIKININSKQPATV